MSTAAILMVIGRAVLGLFFIVAAIRNFAGFSDRAEAATTVYGWKLPAPLVAAGFVLQLVGGLSVLFGIATIWGAAGLILFLVVATALFHNFLMFEGKARDPHLYLTLVNIALVGYCLLVIGISF